MLNPSALAAKEATPTSSEALSPSFKSLHAKIRGQIPGKALAIRSPAAVTVCNYRQSA